MIEAKIFLEKTDSGRYMLTSVFEDKTITKKVYCKGAAREFGDDSDKWEEILFQLYKVYKESTRDFLDIRGIDRKVQKVEFDPCGTLYDSGNFAAMIMGEDDESKAFLANANQQICLEMQ